MVPVHGKTHIFKILKPPAENRKFLAMQYNRQNTLLIPRDCPFKNLQIKIFRLTINCFFSINQLPKPLINALKYRFNLAEMWAKKG
jgi:hypothetical protein